MIKVKVSQKTNKSVLERLQKKINALHGQSTQIGYFKETGYHPTANMSYANLAAIHFKGSKLGHPQRDVFSFIKPFVGGGAAQKKFFGDLLKSYFRYNTSLNIDIMMNNIGRKYMQDGKKVFGNPSMLVVTKNPTPLVDTGELKDHFGYKTTIHYKVRYA